MSSIKVTIAILIFESDTIFSMAASMQRVNAQPLNLFNSRARKVHIRQIERKNMLENGDKNHHK